MYPVKHVFNTELSPESDTHPIDSEEEEAAHQYTSIFAVIGLPDMASVCPPSNMPRKTKYRNNLFKNAKPEDWLPRLGDVDRCTMTLREAPKGNFCSHHLHRHMFFIPVVGAAYPPVTSKAQPRVICMFAPIFCIHR